MYPWANNTCTRPIYSIDSCTCEQSLHVLGLCTASTHLPVSNAYIYYAYIQHRHMYPWVRHTWWHDRRGQHRPGWRHSPGRRSDAGPRCRKSSTNRSARSRTWRPWPPQPRVTHLSPPSYTCPPGPVNQQKTTCIFPVNQPISSVN